MDDNKTSKKALHAEALRLNATKLGNNIYQYKNELQKELDNFYKNKNCYVRSTMLVYSVGTYGNIARLDEVEVIDFPTNSVKHYYYY